MESVEPDYEWQRYTEARKNRFRIGTCDDGTLWIQDKWHEWAAFLELETRFT